MDEVPNAADDENDNDVADDENDDDIADDENDNDIADDKKDSENESIKNELPKAWPSFIENFESHPPEF